MIRTLLTLGLVIILSDVVGLGYWLIPRYPWVKMVPLAGLVILPLVVVFTLRHGLSVAARNLATRYDRFALVTVACWILTYFWGLFMAFPEPQRWSIWLVMVFLVWRLVEVVRHKSEEAEIQARLASDSRGLALRARLAPHFLFNVLASLKGQIRKNPDAALDAVDHLASMFRQLVEVTDQPRISLQKELELVNDYLSLEKMRFGQRLCVSIQIPEDLESRMIPPLSLQVLVENAVKHGVAPLESGGTILVSASEGPQGLALIVEDPGPGFQSALPSSKGTGTALDTLRKRLGGQGTLTFEHALGGHRACLLLNP